MSVSYGDDLHAIGSFAKDHGVREAAKQHTARSVLKGWKPLRLFGNLLHYIVNFIEESFRRSPAALRIPVYRRVGFLQSIRMDVERFPRHAGN